ncbi:MAG TPA: hypothetical protein VG222_17965 [Vicinamibacterales bacterium]|nr:hypothetical protein [Vicinamibacterales bacterium]
MQDGDGRLDMQSGKAPHLGPTYDFYVWASIAAALIVFAGFARSYYLKTLLDAPVLPLLHAHGLVVTAWFVLIVVQSGLIATRRVNLHRRLGVFGALLAGLVVVLGAMTVVRAAGAQTATWIRIATRLVS